MPGHGRARNWRDRKERSAQSLSRPSQRHPPNIPNYVLPERLPTLFCPRLRTYVLMSARRIIGSWVTGPTESYSRCRVSPLRSGRQFRLHSKPISNLSDAYTPYVLNHCPDHALSGRGHKRVITITIPALHSRQVHHEGAAHPCLKSCLTTLPRLRNRPPTRCCGRSRR